MHNKVRNLLFEELATDVANWEEAKNWISRGNGFQTGEYPAGSPEYKYAKYKNTQGRWMEIQNNGSAQEFKNDNTVTNTGTWSWNGTKVVFSWMKPEISGWEDAKQHFIDTNASDYSTGWTYDTQGIWNDYEWARAKLDADNDFTLEIKSDGTYKVKSFGSNDTQSVGKWSWDGSKIIFDKKAGMTKRASGLFTEDDGPADSEGLKVAVFEKNKIGNIGAKGPVVRIIQYYVTPGTEDNVGTGAGCGNDEEKCDGVYGPKTKELVKKWQKEHGVTDDGIWGKESTRMSNDFGEDLEDKVE